jgi:WD40 repeat protein
MYFAGVRSGGVDIWDYQSKQPLVTLKPQPPNEEMFYSRLLCCTNDGGKIAVAAGDCCVIVVWDISDIGSCQMLYMIRQPGPEFITSFCFTKSGEYLVACVVSRTVLYDARNGSFVRVIDDPTSRMAFVHTVGDGILTASVDGTVKLWDGGFEVSRQQRLERSILSLRPQC